MNLGAYTADARIAAMTACVAAGRDLRTISLRLLVAFPMMTGRDLASAVTCDALYGGCRSRRRRLASAPPWQGGGELAEGSFPGGRLRLRDQTGRASRSLAAIGCAVTSSPACSGRRSRRSNCGRTVSSLE